ncbi:hypothetical protein A2108_00595 [Candidatus Wolfebacteria bacterium GWA1_42_9]|uniref:Uncharacterized protein n=1 Tax=Candidatus Wolfebacteria bacterium GWA1_42_9 TaxID=1802553 RepID=A0A1F8DL67_9BACT|nr:MAG: hypothetical protein US39_C0020G0004 [Microgenomates group bacterium GW2011_GWC1_37_12b]KKT22892.1 MAG: hypothetical protein UW08_C0002G0021 [Parcubacteria group bacterium GW2011_GWB1_43_8b]OGM89371.1 MAG: hypothetical protein A2108_00595 [Candidatus Wolfebacteria bacterium GWA1_42_9]
MKIIKNALVSAVLAVLYIAIIATVLTYGEQLFGKINNVLSGMVFLLMFVFSAALMGIIVLGKPIMWYLDGLKKEALKLVFYILGFLFVFLVMVFVILIFVF